MAEFNERWGSKNLANILGDWSTPHLANHNPQGIAILKRMRDHPEESPIVQTAKPAFKELRAQEIREFAERQLRLVEDHLGEAL